MSAVGRCIGVLDIRVEQAATGRRSVASLIIADRVADPDLGWPGMPVLSRGAEHVRDELHIARGNIALSTRVGRGANRPGPCWAARPGARLRPTVSHAYWAFAPAGERPMHWLICVMSS